MCENPGSEKSFGTGEALVDGSLWKARSIITSRTVDTGFVGISLDYFGPTCVHKSDVNFPSIPLMGDTVVLRKYENPGTVPGARYRMTDYDVTLATYDVDTTMPNWIVVHMLNDGSERLSGQFHLNLVKSSQAWWVTDSLPRKIEIREGIFDGKRVFR